MFKPLSSDQQTVLKSFCEAEVDFMVVGGYAVRAHGFGRRTDDLDLFIRRTERNVRNVVDCIRSFHKVDDAEDTIARLLKPKANAFLFQRTVDILNHIDGVLWKDAKPNIWHVSYGNHSVPIIGKSDLIKSKKTRGNCNDLEDIKKLEHDND